MLTVGGNIDGMRNKVPTRARCGSTKNLHRRTVGNKPIFQRPRASERVPVRIIAAVVFLVAPYLAQGGSLDDLLAASRRRPPDTPYRRIRRLLSIIDSLLARRPVSPAARPRLLAAIDGCLGEAGKE